MKVEGSYKAQTGRAGRIVGRFLEASGGRFRCSEIAGRRFADVADHGAYLRGGGCARIVEALAAG